MPARTACIPLGAILGTSCLAAAAFAAPQTSSADKAFVAMVSQGGMYEVALGQAAETQGHAQDIKDQGNTEAHDHTLVGAKLKDAASQAGIVFPDTLDATFKARLARITASSGNAFDKAYVDDMKKIHSADGAAFLKEYKAGTNPALKSFAAETYDIVQRHIGELNAHTSEPN